MVSAQLGTEFTTHTDDPVKYGNIKKEEVEFMCSYGASIAKKNMEQGLSQGLNEGLKALVTSLKKYIKDFDALYNEVISNEKYSNASRDEVKKYYD